MSTLLYQLNTQSHWLADGVRVIWDFNFTGGYINKTHVKAYYKSPTDVRTDVAINYEIDLIGQYQLSIYPAVPNGYTLVIYRDTPKDLPLVSFEDGSGVNERNLDVVAQQSIFVAAESADFLGVTTTGDLVLLAQQAAAAAALATISANAANTSAGAAGINATAAAAAASTAASAATVAATAAVAAGIGGLSAGTGAGVVGYGDVSYSFGSVGGKLNETRSITDKGARPAATAAANLTAVNAAIAAYKRIHVPEGDFKVTSASTNPLGRSFYGAGRMLRPVTGGDLQTNLSCDDGQHVFGQEYLWAFHQAIRGQFAGAAAKAVFSGDSTTYGTGNGAATPFLITDVFRNLAFEAGYKVTTVNRGQPGRNTQHWVDDHLAGDLAENPDLLVIRWGINDPGWLKDQTAPPLDGGQAYPNRRDVVDFATSLRNGLTTIRAAKPVGTLSILLMTPNVTADTPNGRDENWYEQVSSVCRQAARDFECAFIDTYKKWPGARRSAADHWMDNPFGDSRPIHPHDTMNSWIGASIADLCFPNGLRYSMLHSDYGAQPAGSNPNDYKLGWNSARILGSIGWPGDPNGAHITYRTADDIAFQMAFDYSSPLIMPTIRVGAVGTWLYLSRVHQDLTPAGAWVEFVADTTTVRVSKSWKMVTLSGALKGGSATQGTLVITLPVGYRPYSPLWFTVACGTDMDQVAVLQVQPSGNIVIQKCPTNTGLSLAGITFEAFA